MGFKNGNQLEEVSRSSFLQLFLLLFFGLFLVFGFLFLLAGYILADGVQVSHTLSNIAIPLSLVG